MNREVVDIIRAYGAASDFLEAGKQVRLCSTEDLIVLRP